MSTSMNVHYSSATDEWATPQAFFDRLAAEFGGFDLDPCCLPESAKAPRYFTPETDGLAAAWDGRVWMNPPYGRTIGLWTSKARESVQADAQLVVGLLPARTDTLWWHRDVMGAASEVRLVRGRLRFGTATANAPFPSAVAIWRRGVGGFPVFTDMSAV